MFSSVAEQFPSLFSSDREVQKGQQVERLGKWAAPFGGTANLCYFK